jgi:hypothetical protein
MDEQCASPGGAKELSPALQRWEAKSYEAESRRDGTLLVEVRTADP